MKAMTPPMIRGWNAASTPPSQPVTASIFTITATSTTA